ncbi:SPOR domain-containing protein [Pseudomarimonas salicorniae]|uniref:SPOR domain-containing protein n=1 Tax=Pseudomarimonas salicorniae TaxID=2933270 RepID=A0ABT0GDA4_9GAMM|nr:SPOR domain-containing protein [Lysobacter sp. CAU 1642]MCK7592524.1 SPOR domain-containing protein [Lysobacter sp. CAU 1642]
MAARRPKTQARRHGERRTPGWVWLLAGLLLGLGIAVIVLVRDGIDASKLLPRPNPAATTPPEPEAPVAQKGQPAEKKPKYDFYTVLPGREVVIPDAELSAQAKAEPEKPAEPAERLLLQAGAFSDPRRAEEIKAAIAFTGLIARVEPTTAASGQTVHRVMLGPFASLRELDDAKSTLERSGVQAIAIREPGR